MSVNIVAIFRLIIERNARFGSVEELKIALVIRWSGVNIIQREFF
jgi:hypothetical protein